MFSAAINYNIEKTNFFQGKNILIKFMCINYFLDKKYDSKVEISDNSNTTENALQCISIQSP